MARPAAAVGGLGAIGVLALVVISLLGVGGLEPALEQLATPQPQASNRCCAACGIRERRRDYEAFASTVLGSTDDLWNQIFAANELTYVEPTLVLFRGSTQSACGGATSAIGPHYCPRDETIYLDETFFDEMTGRFSVQDRSEQPLRWA